MVDTDIRPAYVDVAEACRDWVLFCHRPFSDKVRRWNPRTRLR